MIKQTSIKNTVYLLGVIVLLLTMIFSFVTVGSAKADSAVTYSDALSDLKKADNFDVGLYPLNAKDYSLKVIQVAESSANELFVYVYQPCARSKELTATSINISTAIEDIKYRNYKLRLVSSVSVFYKYVVEDLTVDTSVPMRSYSISSIYRAFDKSIDSELDNGNMLTEVNYDVSKQYYLGSVNGETFCKAVDLETITITDKFVGMVRYLQGYHLFGSSSCDSHFVAFNTDKPIDKLLEADVYYSSQKYRFVNNTPVIDWLFPDELKFLSDVEDNYVSLDYTQKVETDVNGFGAVSYKWDRIETVEQFIEENTQMKEVFSGAVLNVKVASYITEEGKQALKGKKWVLRFAETPLSVNTTASTHVDTYGTAVGNVTILRLKFEYDGVTYNMGVIDNKQTGAVDENGVNKPINKEDLKVELTEAGKWVLIVVAVILVILAIVFFPYTIKLVVGLGKGLWAILKAIWWLICLPFRGIAALINKIKDGRG